MRPTRAFRTGVGGARTGESARRSRRPRAYRSTRRSATLALHFHEAQRWDKAWQYCRMAGDRALAIYANVEATRFFEKALTAGRRRRDVGPGELASLYELSSDAQYRLGEFGAADRELKAARRLLKPEPERAALLAVKQAMLAARQGNFPQALLRTSRALDRDQGSPRTRRGGRQGQAGGRPTVACATSRTDASRASSGAGAPRETLAGPVPGTCWPRRTRRSTSRSPRTARSRRPPIRGPPSRSSRSWATSGTRRRP